MFKEKNDFLDRQYKEEAKNDMFGEDNISNYDYQENNYNPNYDSRNYKPNNYNDYNSSSNYDNNMNNNGYEKNFSNNSNQTFHPYANNRNRNQQQKQQNNSENSKSPVRIFVGIILAIGIITEFIIPFLRGFFYYGDIDTVFGVILTIVIFVIIILSLVGFYKKKK